MMTRTIAASALLLTVLATAQPAFAQQRRPGSFNAFQSGHFAFQQHDPGSVVSIRKVEVKELPVKK